MPGLALLRPGSSASGLALAPQLALCPQGKVYTILIGHIKKNRIIFEPISHEIRGKLTINPIYIRKPRSYLPETKLLMLRYYLVLCGKAVVLYL